MVMSYSPNNLLIKRRDLGGAAANVAALFLECYHTRLKQTLRGRLGSVTSYWRGKSCCGRAWRNGNNGDFRPLLCIFALSSFPLSCLPWWLSKHNKFCKDLTKVSLLGLILMALFCGGLSNVLYIFYICLSRSSLYSTLLWILGSWLS